MTERLPAEGDAPDHLAEMLQLRSLLNDIWGLVNDPYIGEVRTIELIREKLAEQYDGRADAPTPMEKVLPSAQAAGDVVTHSEGSQEGRTDG